MGYAYMFDENGIHEVEELGKHDPVIVDDLLAVWRFPGGDESKYLIDGLQGGATFWEKRAER